MSQVGLNVYSEIGRLKKVLLHRPGAEIENLTPDLMERLLFDDIPYLEVAREEHDAFAKVFKENGVEVFYLEDLMAETLLDPKVKAQFIETFLVEAGIKNEKHMAQLMAYFNAFEDTKKMVDRMMAGLRREDILLTEGESLSDRLGQAYPFVIDPMPNLYFTRDPFATIGKGISLNKMRTVTRRRETLFADYIFKYHPSFKDQFVHRYYDRSEKYALEGGDMLVLNEKVVAIGISERTDAEAIESFASKLFASDEPFETILAFDIPKVRAFMHLDTVFTMVDHTVFTIHPDIEGPLAVYALKKTAAAGAYTIEKEVGELEDILSKYLEVPSVSLIRCGGKAGIDASREQWNDGSNTLAIAPGEVIVYSRNHVTNKLLKEAGIKLHVIPSSELSRGRGGPRCMSMPLEREPISK